MESPDHLRDKIELNYSFERGSCVSANGVRLYLVAIPAFFFQTLSSCIHPLIAQSVQHSLCFLCKHRRIAGNTSLFTFGSDGIDCRINPFLFC